MRGETLFFCRQCGIINPDGGEPPITFFREIVSMESLRELYRIGRGPSSSHTMGPASAAARFREAFPQADSFQVTLYGSLAKTGRGH